MARRPVYRFARHTAHMCAVVGLSPDDLLRRAGLPSDALAYEEHGLTAPELFALWSAAADLLGGIDGALDLGRKAAHGPQISPVFAFSCSADVATGLTRLAVFKPLVGPIQLDVRSDAQGLTLRFFSADPSHPLPPTMAAFEAVYFTELVRTHTATHVVPSQVDLPVLPQELEPWTDFFGKPPRRAGSGAVRLNAQDAARPLISRNADLLRHFEADLTRQLRAMQKTTPLSARVRAALIELLPAGRASADHVSTRLHLSRRSLQRHLQAEGTSFKDLLEDTRAELARHYLRDGDLSIEEISYLLAYRDPNSFYRAFHGWTGTTPAAVRARG